MLLSIISLTAILPILVYSGMLITSQAFSASSSRLALAVALAIVPRIVDYLKTQMDNALGAGGTNATAVEMDTLAGSGITFQGIAVLGGSAILVGMILAAIAAYVIDRDWKGVAAYALFGAVCAWVGFIHSSQLHLIPQVGELGFNAAWGPTVGYLTMAVIFILMMFYTKGRIWRLLLGR